MVSCNTPAALNEPVPTLPVHRDALAASNPVVGSVSTVPFSFSSTVKDTAGGVVCKIKNTKTAKTSLSAKSFKVVGAHGESLLEGDRYPKSGRINLFAASPAFPGQKRSKGALYFTGYVQYDCESRSAIYYAVTENVSPLTVGESFKIVYRCEAEMKGAFGKLVTIRAGKADNIVAQVATSMLGAKVTIAPKTDVAVVSTLLLVGGDLVAGKLAEKGIGAAVTMGIAGVAIVALAV